MRILICYPPVSDDYEKIRDAGVAPHLSLLCIGTHITKKFPNVQVDLCDGHHTSYKEICNKIKKENYDIIGFSVDFTNYVTSVKLANYAKGCNSEVKIGCGSNHASNMYRQILTNQKAYDFVGINDGEEEWEEYIRYVKGEIDIKDVPSISIFRYNTQLL